MIPTQVRTRPRPRHDGDEPLRTAPGRAWASCQFCLVHKRVSRSSRRSVQRCISTPKQSKASDTQSVSAKQSGEPKAKRTKYCTGQKTDLPTPLKTYKTCCM